VTCRDSIADLVCIARGCMNNDSFLHCCAVTDFNSAVVPPQDRTMPNRAIVSDNDIADNACQFAYIGISPDCWLLAIKFLKHEKPSRKNTVSIKSLLA